MADDPVRVERAILVDLEQFLLRLADHPDAIRAVEESLDCEDFYAHLREHLAAVLRGGPRSAPVRWQRRRP